jgi:hypothetical protein
VCLQRTCEIWAFAFSFAWKYFLLNQKWTYPKKQGGMTPAAVSDRKKELAGTGGVFVLGLVGTGGGGMGGGGTGRRGGLGAGWVGGWGKAITFMVSVWSLVNQQQQQ